MKRVAALVPVKAPALAKERLSDAAKPGERAALAQAMLLDVLRTLRQVRALGACYVVSASADVGELVRPLGVKFLLEPAHVEGLNGAIEWAAAHLAQEGWQSLVVVHGDLPAVRPDDFAELIARHGKAPAVTLCPASRDGGTNVLLCSPPNAIPFRFGPDSFEAHKAAAREAKIEPQVFPNKQMGFDVDTPEDLEALRWICATGGCGPNTARVIGGESTGDTETFAALESTDLETLMSRAGTIRDRTYGNVVTYSRKVFIPVTQLCRDVCHYCTYAKTPRVLDKPYLTIDEMVEIARAGAAAGCKEALFTLGDKPEHRYRAAASALKDMGYSSTLEYVAAAAKAVFEETGLLPHLNPGIMTFEELAWLRPVAASVGLMLEGVAPSLGEKGGAHFGSPDKVPAVRLAAIADAGKAKIPFTTGILVGIGESRTERMDALQAIADLHTEYGHIQEVIIQNFCAKPDTLMAGAPEPELDELLWSIAAARILLPPEISLQAPPNLSPGVLPQLVAAGINDWGGVSPVTPDFVNPEAPWPHLETLATETAQAGKILCERLAVHPRFIDAGDIWLDKDIRTAVLRKADARGFAREDGWVCGSDMPPPSLNLGLSMTKPALSIDQGLVRAVEAASSGHTLSENQITRMFESAGDEVGYICAAADQLRRQTNGDAVSYVINRNINYTNICTYSCAFCAFAKGAKNRGARGPAYDLDLDTIATRAAEAWARGATEVCLQGGIHPRYTGQTYIDICKAVKQVCPDMHLHAFSPLEVRQGAQTLGVSVAEFLTRLKAEGLSTLPGTAAEILDDEVRATLCPDKLNSDEWVSVVETAHSLGLDTTSTIMFGHVDQPRHWARHLLKLRALQMRSLEAGAGKITEFVPLPFVPMDAPIYLRGQARRGPTFRETVLIHAVARLVLNPVIPNIQTSWVKLGDKGVAACLNAGANDLGGTLMNESISSAAGSMHGSERTAKDMETLICELGRIPHRRNTKYGVITNDQPPKPAIKTGGTETITDVAV